MKQILLRGGIPLLAMASLTGCIDDNYDLSDIDTTSELKVKDLILPINIDPVTLGDIIDIKDGDQVKEITINGKTFYAVQESGSFKSDPVNIPTFKIDAPVLSPAVIGFSSGNQAHSVPHAPGNAVVLGITSPVNKDIEYSATDIDASIIGMTDIYTDEMSIVLDFTLDGGIASQADIELNDLIIDIPKGLTVENMIPEGATYNDGRLHIPSLKLINGTARLSLAASAINLPANNAKVDYPSHSLTMKTKVNIESASLMISAKDGSDMTVPDEVSINVDYLISPVNVMAISGKIHYTLEGDALDIPAISLEDIPDFLAGDDTDLILSNPQIYLKVNNPVADNKLEYQSGIQITATRDNGEQDKLFSLDNGYFTVSYDKGVAGPYNFCMSPVNPADVPSDFSNPEWVEFSDLGYVISGNGLPSHLDIRLVDPQIYEQNVTRFELGRNLDALSGEWEFIAPLALKEGSKARIIYTDTADGWNDGHLDAITIQTLEVSMNVTNDTPLAAHITGYPVDKNGKQISGVTIEGADIPGGAKEAPVKIHISGEVKHLDGITFTATVTPASGETLAPSQTFTLTNIKAKVSGNYIKEL